MASSLSVCEEAILYSLIIKLVKTYGVFVFLWFLLNRFLQDSWWGFVVLDKFAEYFLVASIPVFILSLLLRRKVIVLYAMLPLLVCAYFYLPFFLKYQTQPAQVSSESLRVGTYNIWNHNNDLEAVVQLINMADSHIIAIQELTDDQKPDFIRLLSTSYPYFHVSTPVYGGTTAVFSRIPLTNVEEINFNIDRPAILADIEWQGSTVSVVSAHLNPSFWAYYQQPWMKIPGNYHQYIKDQNMQAQMIMDALHSRTNSSAAILACDCNSQETASTNRLLGSVFKDSFRTLGWQFGKPAEAHLQFERDLSHIDYIWFAGNVEPTAIYRSIESAGSDHQPVYADFQLSK